MTYPSRSALSGNAVVAPCRLAIIVFVILIAQGWGKMTRYLGHLGSLAFLGSCGGGVGA